MPKAPPYLNLISKEEKASALAIKQFLEAVRKYENELSLELYEIFREEIEIGRDRKIKKTVQNVKKINAFQNKVTKLLLAGQYNKDTKIILKQLSENSIILNSYFSAITRKFDFKDTYKELVKVNSLAVQDSLQRSGVNYRFTERAGAIVNSSVRQGLELKDVRAQFASVVSDDRILSRYAGQVATDSMNQFSREYISSVSDDLKLGYYFFKGAAVKDSRSFCLCRKGKYYTLKEVLLWGAPDHKGCGFEEAGKWAGQIAGTNRDNIKTNLGGWRCVDRLVPVSKVIYSARK